MLVQVSTGQPFLCIAVWYTDAPSLETFKVRWDGALSHAIWLKMSLLTARGGLD